MSKKVMTDNYIKQAILGEIGEEIITEIIAVYRGESKSFKSSSGVILDLVLSWVDAAVKNGQIIETTQIEGAADIVKCVLEGRLTANQGLQFLAVLQKEQDIKLLPELKAQLQELLENE